MAEGFANHYGSDVLIASSAGLSPISYIVPETVAIMAESGVDVSKHVPSYYEPLGAGEWDIVVNMSGMRLPGKRPKHLLEWEVVDPFRKEPEVYRQVRNDIEHRVMLLILRLRREAA